MNVFKDKKIERHMCYQTWINLHMYMYVCILMRQKRSVNVLNMYINV